MRGRFLNDEGPARARNLINVQHTVTRLYADELLFLDILPPLTEHSEGDLGDNTLRISKFAGMVGYNISIERDRSSDVL